eukprot:TRINITY_DN685_c0_g2_i3.p3 TRINITY_DN685_c0_g2~~TRINITY_DN685_c0_g2_i3.p3  ORF type:complete len:107 (-),score=18.07 TRINITY_DN685_c0_g2_i3:152-472(-)
MESGMSTSKNTDVCEKVEGGVGREREGVRMVFEVTYHRLAVFLTSIHRQPCQQQVGCEDERQKNWSPWGEFLFGLGGVDESGWCEQSVDECGQSVGRVWMSVDECG